MDLEFALWRRERRAGDGFFRECIEPWIDPKEIVRPGRETMSRALWAWMGREREGTGRRDWPGRAFSGALTGVGFGAVLLAFCAGVGTVLGLLGTYDGRTFPVLLLLLLTIGVQWGLLMLSVFGFLTWGWWGGHAFVTGAQRLVSAGIATLVKRSLGKEGERWWRETVRTRRLFGVPAMQVSQWAGVAFGVGSFLALGACVLFLSVRFGWETTAVHGVAPYVHGMVRVLSAPWAALCPQWIPDETLINATRIELRDGKPILPPLERSSGWYPFLLVGILFWGVLPRLGLVMIAAWMKHRSIAAYAFQERLHREWWREMTEVSVHVAVSGPADGAFALLLGGLQEPEGLRRACLQQLRLNLEDRAQLGVGSLADDLASLERAVNWLAKRKEARLILVAESWALVPKEFREFHEQLRGRIGGKIPVDVLLVGLPAASGGIGEPSGEDISIWERFAAELGDPMLHLQPYKSVLAH